MGLTFFVFDLKNVNAAMKVVDFKPVRNFEKASEQEFDLNSAFDDFGHYNFEELKNLFEEGKGFQEALDHVRRFVKIICSYFMYCHSYEKCIMSEFDCSRFSKKELEDFLKRDSRVYSDNESFINLLSLLMDYGKGFEEVDYLLNAVFDVNNAGFDMSSENAAEFSIDLLEPLIKKILNCMQNGWLKELMFFSKYALDLPKLSSDLFSPYNIYLRESHKYLSVLVRILKPFVEAGEFLGETKSFILEFFKLDYFYSGLISGPMYDLAMVFIDRNGFSFDDPIGVSMLGLSIIEGIFLDKARSYEENITSEEPFYEYCPEGPKLAMFFIEKLKEQIETDTFSPNLRKFIINYFEYIESMHLSGEVVSVKFVSIINQLWRDYKDKLKEKVKIKFSENKKLESLINSALKLLREDSKYLQTLGRDRLEVFVEILNESILNGTFLEIYNDFNLNKYGIIENLKFLSKELLHIFFEKYSSYEEAVIFAVLCFKLPAFSIWGLELFDILFEKGEGFYGAVDVLLDPTEAGVALDFGFIESAKDELIENFINKFKILIEDGSYLELAENIILKLTASGTDLKFVGLELSEYLINKLDTLIDDNLETEKIINTLSKQLIFDLNSFENISILLRKLLLKGDALEEIFELIEFALDNPSEKINKNGLEIVKFLLTYINNYSDEGFRYFEIAADLVDYFIRIEDIEIRNLGIETFNNLLDKVNINIDFIKDKDSFKKIIRFLSSVLKIDGLY